MEFIKLENTVHQLFGLQTNYPGEDLCGDDWFVFEHGDQLLIALIDGLGHGQKAHESAQRAKQTISDLANAGTFDLPLILNRCHSDLRRMRGAAIALVHLNGGEGQFLSVGNVQLEHSSRRPLGVIARPGIVGRKTIRIRPMTFQYESDLYFYLFTDGLRAHFEKPEIGVNFESYVKSIFNDHNRANDDASLIVFRQKN